MPSIAPSGDVSAILPPHWAIVGRSTSSDFCAVKPSRNYFFKPKTVFNTMKISILPLLLLACAIAQAQPLRPDVLASAGTTLSNAANTARLSFTVGEVAVQGQALPSFSYGQGFHNSALQTVRVRDLDLAAWSIEAWPNPVSQMLFLRFDVPHAGDYLSASVWNLLGQPVVPACRLDAFSEKQILVGHLPAGVYLLQLADQNGRKAAVKFVKAD
jgi:hypothetical protein